MGILQWFLGKKKQFPISTTFKETIAFFGSSLNFWIISIPHVISKTTSAKDSKERPISKKWWQLKCSQGLCWRLVELSSPTNGVFSSAGKLCIVYSLAALSKLWPASVGMFSWKKQHWVDKPTYVRKIWKKIIETAINEVYIRAYTPMTHEYESDLRSYEHYLSSSEKKAWKK